LDVGEEFACEVTLETADDFDGGHAFFGSSFDVMLVSGWVAMRTITMRQSAELAWRSPPRLRRSRPLVRPDEGGHDVDTVVEQGLAGAVDAAVVDAATAARRLIITLDRGFGDVRAYPTGAKPAFWCCGSRTNPRRRSLARSSHCWSGSTSGPLAAVSRSTAPAAFVRRSSP
jgi:Domain of unknown function (DUF5615)